MFIGHIKNAVSSLRAARWRTYLTMLGIVIGISSVVIIVSLGQGLKEQVVGQIGKLGPNIVSVRSGKLFSSQSSNFNYLALLGASTLTDQDVASIAATKNVEAVAPINFVTNSASTDQSRLDNVSVIGSSKTLSSIFGLSTVYGDFLSDNDTSGKVS